MIGWSASFRLEWRRIGRCCARTARSRFAKGVSLFSHCSKKQLAEIAANITDLVVFPAGRRLIREGAVGREFMVIVEGAVEVRRKGRKVKELGAGDFIGEIALISKAAKRDGHNLPEFVASRRHRPCVLGAARAGA